MFIIYHWQQNYYAGMEAADYWLDQLNEKSDIILAAVSGTHLWTNQGPLFNRKYKDFVYGNC